MLNEKLTYLCLLPTFFILHCSDDPTSPKNTPPKASFSISPDTGDKSTIFQFDASACSDHEDPDSVLEVRWDWENDGSWDSGYSTEKTATHQYPIEASFIINMEVRDTGGLSDSTTLELVVETVTGLITDIDGNVYQIIKIGDQWWMAENLKVTHYRNGDAIPNVIGHSVWSNLTSGAYASYDFIHDNIAIYGLFYNWYAIDDSRGLAPEGSHVPTQDEWQTLIDFLGGFPVAGGKMKEAGTAHWNSPNTGATNESGFTALPGGYRPIWGEFTHMGYLARFYSSTEEDIHRAQGRYLYFESSAIMRLALDKHCGFSIRCVRD